MLKRLLPWYILSIAILFYCYVFFLRTSPSVVVAQSMLHFHTTAFGVSLLASSYYFAYTLGQIPGGYILDRYRTLSILSIATLICALGSFAFVATDYLGVALTARFLTGLASAVSFIGILNLARRYLPEQHFTLVAGIAISIGTLAGSYAQVAASYVIANNQWSTLFVGAALVGLLLAGLIKLSQRWMGTETVLTAPPRDHFKAVWILLRHRGLWANAIMGGLFYLPTSVFAAVWGIHFLQTQYQLTDTAAAYCISDLFLGWVIASPVMGYIADRWHCERVLIYSGFILLSGLIFLILFAHPLIENHLRLYFILFGFFSSIQIVVWKFFKDLIPATSVAVGIALTNMIITLTTAVADVVIGYAINVSSHYTLEPSAVDSQTSLLLMPLALFFGVLITFFLLKKGYTR